VSFRYVSGINKPGFNPLAAQTSVTTYQPYLYSWGNNNTGQLGLGNTTSYSSPKQVGALINWLDIACGGYSTKATKTDGTLWTWGRGFAGQLGLGNATYYSSPKQVGALTAWSSVGSGENHSMAVKTDGTLWTWGLNNNGQLGLNSATYSFSSPNQVGALTNWLRVAGGYAYSVAVKTDGTLWSWGQNNLGQLGLGDTSSRSSPVQVGALTTWINIACGSYNHTLAVKTDGTLWSWGRGASGALGLGNTTNYSSPKQVGVLTTWSKIAGGIAGGRQCTVAVTTVGAMWSWGSNNFGQLGLGNTTNYSSPKQIGALTTWLNVSCGTYAPMAIKTDGTLWGWGQNQNGQCGLGNTSYYSSPKQVGALTTWLKTAARLKSTIALLY